MTNSSLTESILKKTSRFLKMEVFSFFEAVFCKTDCADKAFTTRFVEYRFFKPTGIIQCTLLVHTQQVCGVEKPEQSDS
mgnify:FL=1